MNKGAAFRVDRLTVAYGGQQPDPIENLDLTLHAGEITCLLGKSGCGKTTLLKALGGFVAAASTGGVIFEGRYLSAPSPKIVMIFQENNLYPWLSVRGNVAFGLKFQRPAVANPMALVDAMLAAVGLTDAARQYPHQLSGGMRQRTAIARALISEPEVLLLDEPFSALDIGLRRRMQAQLRTLWETTGKTMVMVTHSIEEAILVGHRVIVIGNRPAQVLADVDTSAAQMKDRYSPAFLDLQRRLEAYIE
jgi:ABC-type nitrate/sulfonate/bicarbonate transport system ATPase subunit